MTYVTNGVHVPTFLAAEWYETVRPLSRPRLAAAPHRQALLGSGIHAIPDQLFWSVRQSLKSQMLHLVRNRIAAQHLRNQGSEAHLDRMLRSPIRPIPTS